MKILIAEDQTQLRTILLERLNQHGFIVDAAEDGGQAIDYLDHGTYDVALLDIMMPQMNGLEVLQWIRSHRPHLPVLLLTAKDAVKDRVKGLELGADDYLIKPFAFEELLARVHSLLRRSTKAIQEVLQVGDLSLNRSTKEVKRNDTPLQLTKKEFLILEALMRHAGEPLSRERLEMVSSDLDYEGYSNIVDVYIRFLRKKVDEPFASKLIHTVRGFGYVIREDV